MLLFAIRQSCCLVSNRGFTSDLYEQVLNSQRYCARTDGEKSIELVAVDRCEGCPSFAPNSLDIAEKAFIELFGSTERGRSKVGETSWSFI